MVRDLQGQLIGEVGAGNRKDIRNAVEAARGASSQWSKTTGHSRAQIIYYLGENLAARAGEFAWRIVHFTGYEIPVDRIKVPAPEFRLLGNLLGSADILAQMADRCYLEKCYDRLYPEFVRGGIARKRHDDGREEIIFASAADLIFKTPRFYQGATRRLKEDLGGCYNYVEQHFGGQNLYFNELEKNIIHARAIAVEGDISLLRRRPPRTTEGEDGGEPQQQRLI